MNSYRLVSRSCPPKVCGPYLAAAGSSPPRRPPLMESRALHSVVRDNVSGCLGYPIPPWRPRFRAACAVFLSSPSAGHFRVQLILSCASAPPPESLESQPAPALMSGTPSLGFPPSSRHRSAESTHAGVPGPLRSVHDVSHVLDGFLLHRALRVYFTPQPRPGFALQGFSLARSRTGSSPAVALLSFTRCPCPQFYPWAPGPRARLQGFAPLTSPSQTAVV